MAFVSVALSPAAGCARHQVKIAVCAFSYPIEEDVCVVYAVHSWCDLQPSFYFNCHRLILLIEVLTCLTSPGLILPHRHGSQSAQTGSIHIYGHSRSVG